MDYDGNATTYQGAMHLCAVLHHGSPDDALCRLHIGEKYLKKPYLWFTSRALYMEFADARRRTHVALYGPRFDTLTAGNPTDKWYKQFVHYQRMIRAFHSDTKHRRPQLTLPPQSNAYLRYLLHEFCESLGLVHDSVFHHTTEMSGCPRCGSPRIKKLCDGNGYESQDELDCAECHLNVYWRRACDVDMDYKVIVIRRTREPSRSEKTSCVATLNKGSLILSYNDTVPVDAVETALFRVDRTPDFLATLRVDITGVAFYPRKGVTAWIL